MVKRHSLKIRPVKKITRKQFNLKRAKLYYSGFCLTDNKNFALFDVSDKFLIDNELKGVIPFQLSEDDLQMIIDRNDQLRVSRGNILVTVDDYGLIDRNIFNLFDSDQAIFHPVVEWFGKPCNRLITIVLGEGTKPIGVFKTVKDEKEKPNG